MNVVNNIGSVEMEVRFVVVIEVHWKFHCEFSLICYSIFDTEKRMLTAILVEDANFHESKNCAQLDVPLIKWS